MEADTAAVGRQLADAVRESLDCINIHNISLYQPLKVGRKRTLHPNPVPLGAHGALAGTLPPSWQQLALLCCVLLCCRSGCSRASPP